MTTSFASLSIHNFIHNVGSDAGFAAIIGLALVVILFFAHARETSNLRDNLDASQERIDSLEHQLRQAGRQRAAAAQAPLPVDPVTGVPIAPRPGGVRPTAATAAGVGSVAATAVGAAATAVAPRPPAQPVRAGAGVPRPEDGLAAPNLGSATKLIPDPELPAAASDPAGLTDAASTGGIGATTAAAPPSNGTAAYAGAGPSRPPRTVPARGSRRGSLLDERPARRRGWLIGAIGAVVVAVVVIVLIIALSGGHGASTSKSTPVGGKHATRAKKDRPPAVDPSQFSVAVLNGTAVQGLAADVFKIIGAKGFQKGPITNAGTQTESKTVVYYVKRIDQAAADKVAQLLGVPDSQVQAASSAVVQSCATNPAGVKTSCNANVIVSAGSDQSKLAGTVGANSATVG